MNNTQFPTREEVFAQNGWKTLSVEKMATLGLDAVASNHKDGYQDENNPRKGQFVETPSGAVGYTKLISQRAALSEVLASSFATRLELPCATPKMFAARDKNDTAVFVCFSPIEGAEVRQLEAVVDKGEHRSLSTETVDYISKTSSSLVPFWMLIAATDVTAGGLVLSKSPNKKANLYAIDHEATGGNRNRAEIVLADLFKAHMPFFLDEFSMASTTLKIVAMPASEIRKTVLESFDACKVGLSGNPASYISPAAETVNGIIKNQQSLNADLHSAEHMDKIFGLRPPNGYQTLNHRPAKSTGPTS